MRTPMHITMQKYNFFSTYANHQQQKRHIKRQNYYFSQNNTK